MRALIGQRERGCRGAHRKTLVMLWCFIATNLSSRALCHPQSVCVAPSLVPSSPRACSRIPTSSRIPRKLRGLDPAQLTCPMSRPSGSQLTSITAFMGPPRVVLPATLGYLPFGTSEPNVTGNLKLIFPNRTKRTRVAMASKEIRLQHDLTSSRGSSWCRLCYQHSRESLCLLGRLSRSHQREAR